MSLLPVSASRTSTPLTTQRLLSQLNADQLALQSQYEQLATGRRVTKLSDDPASASRAVSLYRGIERSEQLVRNATSTASFYQAADSSLARVDQALVEARGAAVQGAQNVISQDERVALSATVQEAIDSVFSSGNSMFRDHPLLGGFLGQGNAFRYDGADIVFDGNAAIAQTKLGNGVPTPINVNASESLGAFSVFLEGDKLNAALDESTRLSDLRRGEGVSPGILRLSGGGNFTEVDLRSASTIGDVAELLSEVELEGRMLSASVTADGLRVEYFDGLSGTLAIDDAVGSSMAEELSILNRGGFVAPPIVGDRLLPRVTPTTRLADLNDGVGLSLDSGIQIQQGDKTVTIDFAGAETVSDVLIKINRSSADIHAELSEAEGRIVLRSLRSGVDISIGENGGDDATELGIRSAKTNSKISELNRGQGLRLNPDGADLAIIRPDGVEFELDLDDAETIDDVMQLIRTHPQNLDSRRVLVSLNEFGNGLQLKAPPDAGALTIKQLGISDAGIQLGLVTAGQSESLGSVVGASDTIIGVDYAPKDAGGALDTLLRLQTAILDGDIIEIGRLQARLDEDLDLSTRTRGRVGVWARNSEQLKSTAEENAIALQSQLSNEVDADLATVISDISQRQLSLEASMRVLGQTAQLTVLNFL